MAEKISVQIALEGGKQVEEQLAGIGDAGKTMAEGIAKAGEASQTTGAGFDALIAATDKLTEATNKATEAHSKLSLETVKTTAEIAKYTVEIGLAGVEIVQAVRHHETLIQSLIKLAGITNTTIKAVSLLTPELALVGVTIGSTAAAVAGGVIAFEAIEKAATKAATGLETLNHSLQMLAETSGQSFKSLQEGKDAFEQLGIGGDRFEGVVKKVNEAISSLDINKKLAEGAENVGKTLAGSSEEVKALANSLGAVLPLVKGIEDGVKGLTFDPLTTAQTKIDAVTASMKQAVDAGKNAGQVLLQFIVSADKLSAIQVGKAFGITEEDVDRIRRLAASGVTVEEIFKRIQGTGVLISPESAAALDKMRDSIAQANSAWERLKQSLASTIFADLGAQVSSVFNDIKAGAFNTAAAIVETFNSAATQAIAALKKIGQSEWGQAVNTTLQNAITGLNSIIANLVGTIMRGMGASEQAIKALQDKINELGPAGEKAGQQAARGLQLVANPLTGMPELINTTNQALQQTRQTGAQAGQQGAQGFQVWNEELGKAVPATQQVTSATQGATASVSDFLSKIGSITWDVISSAGVAAWNALTGTINGAATAVANFFSTLASGAWDKVKALLGLGGGAPAAAGGMASGGFIGGRGTGTSDSNLAWLSRGEHIMPARVVRQPGVLAFLEALRRGGGIPGFAAGGTVGGSSFISDIKGAMQSFIRAYDAIDQTNNTSENAATSIAKAVIDAQRTLNQSLTGIQQTMGSAIKTLANLLGASGARSGGLLGGRGSGTSDSNLAWLSRGEYITPARAVAQPGVLAFLEALRRSGGNLRGVLDGMGRFALGGMIRGPMPAFAGGGLAGGMSNVTIQFPGLPAIGGLRASADVVDQLHRAAALAQVRSGGRKPSRYS